jgi:uncharacterized coiled-coil protein SlyX
VITEERAEEVQMQWDGRLQRLRTFMENQTANQNTLLKELQKSIVVKIKDKADRRIKELEKSTGNYITNICSKTEDMKKMLDKCNKILTPQKKVLNLKDLIQS